LSPPRRRRGGSPDRRHSRCSFKLTQLTRDTGLTWQSALSPDNKLIAYASDSAGKGNLDIWLQQIGGGEPMQLTRNEADAVGSEATKSLHLRLKKLLSG
jgi:Tol biopolymer transport system component